MAKKRLWLWNFTVIILIIMTISVRVKQRIYQQQLARYRCQNDSNRNYGTSDDHSQTRIHSLASHNYDAYSEITTDSVKVDSLPDAYARSASPDKIIVFSLISYGFREMFMNFYLTSIAKHNITNVLFLAADELSCELLRKRTERFYGVCYPIRKEQSSDALRFMSKQYLHIMVDKTRLTLDMLERGYTVLEVDVDIVFLKNPLPYLAETCPKHSCDVAAQSNWFGANGGFVYAHPTNATASLYREMVKRETEDGLDDQTVLNNGMKVMNRTGKMSAIILQNDLFPCGAPGVFFESTSCPSQEKYDKAIVVHNNWIYGIDDKIARFKECFLWEYAGDQNSYYADTSRRYIQYHPGIYRWKGPEALLNIFTFGVILNRTVILPTVLSADNSILGDGFYALRIVLPNRTAMYNSHVEFRESSFLSNNFVADEVKESLSPVYDITGGRTPETSKIIVNIKFDPDDINQGPIAVEILRWFHEEQSSVLRIVPMQYGLSNINHVHYLGNELYHAFRR